ncbi:MAG: AbiV family abortive infection protein [Candidatus Desulforudis sp.]|nr:AbiV family abortive infection protein [Desulforudis sp.]
MYSFDEEQVVKGLRLCLENADRLVQEAEILRAAGHLERALSLSVLALEELGKLVCINGLALSLASQSRGEDSFNYVRRTHQAKLSALYSYPLVIFQFAGLDERLLGNEENTGKVNNLVQHFYRNLERLEPWIGGVGNLEKLNQWKQWGLYVDFDDEDGFTAPSGFAPEMVAAVKDLAGQIVGGFNYILPPNLDRYREAIKAIRKTVTPEQFNEIRNWIIQEIKDSRS